MSDKLFKQIVNLFNEIMPLCIIGQKKSESNIRLLEEAKGLFSSVLFVPIEGIRIGLKDEFRIYYRTTDLLKFDAILPRIPKKYHSYAYQLLSLFPPETFIPIKPITFLISEERFFLLSVLRKRDIPTLNIHLARSTVAAQNILESAEFPLILRVPGKGSGVVVETLSEAKGVIEAITSLDQPILIEDIVKDMISVYVIHPDVLAAIKKTSEEKDIIFSAGKIKNIGNIKPEIKQLALETAEAIDTQMARVDISLNSEMKVVNIDLNPNLMSVSKVSKLDMPKRVMENIYENYKKHKDKPLLMKFFEDAKSVVRDVLKNKQLLI